jgi:hypothetical protein
MRRAHGWDRAATIELVVDMAMGSLRAVVPTADP